MRPDLDVVSSMIPAGARVLDLGCGDGALLDHLIRDRGCDGVGVEIAPSDFNTCVARGVPVVEGDIDEGLSDFPSGAFDAVVLSQTLQATRRPAFVLREMARVGSLIVVSFPNFGHWTIRLRLAARGRMPSGRLLPYPWHETPNIHLCTITDFEMLARSEALRVNARVWLDGSGGRASSQVARRPNLLASGAVFSLAGGARA